MPVLPPNDRAILRLETPSSKRYEMYRDEAVKGLVLRIMKTGHRAWIAERRKPNGSKQETSLGAGDSLTLSEAREACIKALAENATNEHRGEGRAPGTFAAEFEDYCLANRIIPEHAKEYRRTLSIYGAALWNMPVNKITRSMVLTTRKRIEVGDFEANLPYTPKRGGAAKANDFIRYGSMVMAWSQEIKTNPFHGIQLLARDNEEGESKKYVFQPKSWPAIFDVIERWASDDRDLMLTHLMLGARPAGTCRMRWDRLDLDKGTYRLTNNPEECMGWKPAKSP
ncbi:MAG: Arm DNA-binding domain-containing protein, partial [Azoarcus sp.]|nr:Arm DNA-binding domain-containing protein [Azoarcus sp.]